MILYFFPLSGLFLITGFRLQSIYVHCVPTPFSAAVLLPTSLPTEGPFSTGALLESGQREFNITLKCFLVLVLQIATRGTDDWLQSRVMVDSGSDGDS